MLRPPHELADKLEIVQDTVLLRTGLAEIPSVVVAPTQTPATHLEIGSENVNLDAKSDCMGLRRSIKP